MPPSAWDDLREDARTFTERYPQAGHTLLFVPDRSAEGVAGIDVDAGGSGDPARMLAQALKTARPLRELGVSGIESRILHRTQRSLGDGDGFVAEWLWSDPVGGTIHPDEGAGQAWHRLCDALWQLIVDRVETIMPSALEGAEAHAPTIGRDPNTSDAARLLHWLAWSGEVEGLRANVDWRLVFRPTADTPRKAFAKIPRTQRQTSPFGAGRPERPGPLPNEPWLHVAGWWWSTIEPAGRALVAAIDRLRRAVVDEREEAGAAGAKGRRRPKRTAAEIARDEGKIAAHLAEHPDATRDQISAATGIAHAHVSGSRAWGARRAQRKKAREANRARGVGGLGDDG